MFSTLLLIHHLHFLSPLPADECRFSSLFPPMLPHPCSPLFFHVIFPLLSLPCVLPCYLNSAPPIMSSSDWTDPWLSLLSRLLPSLSSHGDARSAGPGSGLGTSACLVRLCLPCEVFSHTAAFHGPDLADHTSVCMPVCLGILWMKCSEVVNSFIACVHSYVHPCRHASVQDCCSLAVCSMRVCVFTVPTCVCLD